jgi:YjbE family integral membrane protein
VDFLWQDITNASFWIAALQIIGVNIVLSGDNAVVIAMACMTLPPKQRLWGMILGAGVAVLLRVLFTLVVAEAMNYPFLKLVGGVLLFWVAVKLVTEDSEGEGGVEAAENLWRAVRIVAIADIVMSLDNVIAIAASAELAAARVDLAHAAAIKTTLIIFGLATSVPMIVAGSAILMALLERFRILVWAGGALLGWVAGDIMATDPAVVGWLGESTAHGLHAWAGRAGALIVAAIGLFLVRRHRKHLELEEILACVGLVVWIIGDIVLDKLFGGSPEMLTQFWIGRGVIFFVLLGGYVMARSNASKKELTDKA